MKELAESEVAEAGMSLFTGLSSTCKYVYNIHI